MQGVDAMTANHPAFPSWPDGYEPATGLTKREWLMAHFPLDPLDLRPKNGPGFSNDEDRLRTHARLARIWADAIIKEAARDE